MVIHAGLPFTMFGPGLEIGLPGLTFHLLAGQFVSPVLPIVLGSLCAASLHRRVFAGDADQVADEEKRANRQSSLLQAPLCNRAG